MKALALALVILLVHAVVSPAPVLRSQTETTPGYSPVPRYVVLDQHVRNVLTADWDAHAKDSAILERAYCVTFQKDVWVIGEWVWRAVEIRVADSVEGQTPHSIESFSCGEGKNVTTLHLHPAQTCISDTECANGGTLAWQCMPSDVDEQSLRRSGRPFALIQCDRNAVIAYWP